MVTSKPLMDMTANAKAMEGLLKSMLISDNNIRIQAELDFNHSMKSDLNLFFLLLIQIAHNEGMELIVRQSALLHIKRLVPLYWSPAFDKYIGTKTISQDVKKTLRTSLLTLIGDPDSKIRSSSAYATVQIAAVDYPDEWPELLDTLYTTIKDQTSSNCQIIGALSVLGEVFDEVVTFAQFFEGGIGAQVLKTCESLFQNQNYDLEAKVETLRLMKILCRYFERSDFEIGNREQFSNFVIPQIYDLLLSITKLLSANEASVKQLISWDFKYEIYHILNALMNSFSYLLEQFLLPSYEIVLHDIGTQKEIYCQLLATDFSVKDLNRFFIDVEQFYSSQRERREPYPFLTHTLTKEFEFLKALIELKKINNREEISKLLNLLLDVTTLSQFIIEEQNSDPNLFVTYESGLNPELTLRDSARELLGDMDATDNQIFVEMLIQKLSNTQLMPSNQIQTEAIVYLLACCFDNDDTIVGEVSFDLNDFLTHSVSIITNDKFLNSDSQFLIARFILMIPKLLFKYIDQCKNMAVPLFTEICSIIPKLGSSNEFAIINSSILISLQYYNYFLRASEFSVEIQTMLIGLVAQLEEDADDDMSLMLLEVMTIIISINSQKLSENEEAIRLILTIGFKNDSNFSLNTSMFECIDDLLKDISQLDYTDMISCVFPFLLSKISEFNGEYSSQIDLSLQSLAAFLKNQDTHKITRDIFNYTFPIINNFILICEDDELLQSGSELLVQLLRYSSEFCQEFIDLETNESGTTLILKNISKFLSPEMSDRAIVKLGDLITVLLEKFDVSLQQYLEDILKALTVRLVNAKEVPTIENMILIFNMLTVSQPESTINFLESFEIDKTTALKKIMPIWFQAYEVMRGYDSILSNVRAFIEIYKLEDSSIKQILVDGNPIPNQVEDGVIITRSMAKKISIKYEQIPVDAKIVTLLLEELKNSMPSIKVEDQEPHTHTHGDEDEDEWEDIGEIAGYSLDQLKRYVDKDGELKRGGDGFDDDLKNCLLDFFKLCTTQKIGNFEEIYDHYLSDSERGILSEYLLLN